MRRIPLSEGLRDHASNLATTFLELVKIENEENAVVCLKIIYDLHRMYYSKLENFAQPFLDMAFEIYGNASNIAKEAQEASEGSVPTLTASTVSFYAIRI